MPTSPGLDALGRTPIADAIKRDIAAAFTAVPDGKRGALLVRADTDGTAILHLAGRFGDHWKVAGGGGISLPEKRPHGYVAVEASW
jgi:hypothetical protein